MQPHSMCIVALVNYCWNCRRPLPSRCKVRISYRNSRGDSKLNIYRLSDIKENAEKKELQATVIRDGGGLSCTVYASRSSSDNSSTITLKHDTNHLSGLREEFKLGSSSINSGKNENSKRYGSFSGSFNPNIPERLTLNCEIKNDSSSVWVRYESEMEDIK
jgi:hypothetical protein